MTPTIQASSYLDIRQRGLKDRLNVLATLKYPTLAQKREFDDLRREFDNLHDLRAAEADRKYADAVRMFLHFGYGYGDPKRPGKGISEEQRSILESRQITMKL